jgi:hypothetical protein
MHALFLFLFLPLLFYYASLYLTLVSFIQLLTFALIIKPSTYHGDC